MYNLVELIERISAAIAATGITDERLLVGMRYLRHAFWLNEQTVTMHDDPENARMLISSCFLHLYKAATAVAGDPTKKDGYQKLTNDLGLGAEFLTVRMKDLRDIRNDYDVAHYSLKPIDNDELHRVFGASVQTVTDALAARLALVSKSSASA